MESAAPVVHVVLEAIEAVRGRVERGEVMEVNDDVILRIEEARRFSPSRGLDRAVSARGVTPLTESKDDLRCCAAGGAESDLDEGDGEFGPLDVPANGGESDLWA
jgi:hypothetical protein